VDPHPLYMPHFVIVLKILHFHFSCHVLDHSVKLDASYGAHS
jgi:hypothetical protein